MRRTTILLEDDLAEQLEYERRRRNLSAAAIVREALSQYLAGGSASPKRLAFIGLGRSGYRDTGRKAEVILASEWGGDPATRAGQSKKRAGTARRPR
jgi:Ribbon-helix-helix protein, copG family